MADRDPLLDKPDGAPSWVPDVDRPRSVRILVGVIAIVFGLGLLGFVVRSADSPADPTLAVPAAEATSADVRAESVGAIVVTVTLPTGEAREFCLLDADTPDERQLGLMNILEFGAVEGALFSWDTPQASTFVMIDTPVPLAISWWAADGSFVNATEMEPCREADPDACARYPSGGEQVHAVELPLDAAAGLDVGAGATLAVGGEC